MRPMTKAEFKRKYLDTHIELQAQQALSSKSYNNGSLIKHSPGDKNITRYGKIPGKDLIEKEAFEKRAELFRHYLMDAVEVKNIEILDMSMKDLLNVVTKNMPQKIESKVETEFTFSDYMKKATLELEKIQEIETTAKEVDGPTTDTVPDKVQK